MKHDGMFYGATPLIFERAKQLRLNPTIAEQKFWEELGERDFAFKFRWQHPIDIYIVDFYCHPIRLAVELDGRYHLNKEVQENDSAREFELNELGIRMVRFTNEEVIYDVESCVDRLYDIVTSSDPTL